MRISTETIEAPASGLLDPAKRLRELWSTLDAKTSIDVMTPLHRIVQQLLVARGAYAGEAELGDYRLHHVRVGGSGKGPPVLLVHGLGGTAGGFSRVMFPLAQRYRQVWAVDLPGHGFSPMPKSGPVTLERHLEALQRFANEVIGEPVVLVGNSLGGAMSLQFASESPERVRGLALLAPAGAQVSPERFQELVECLRVETSAQSRALMRRLFARVPPLALAMAGQMRKTYGCDAVRALLDQALARPHLEPEVLARLTQPILLLWGGSERLLPQEGVEYFRSHLPEHARVEVVEGWGHVPQMEHPAAVVRRLVRFADEAGL